MEKNVKNLWVLFGFSDAIGDQLDAIHSNKDRLKSIVLNIDIDNVKLKENLSVLDYDVDEAVKIARDISYPVLLT